MAQEAAAEDAMIDDWIEVNQATAMPFMPEPKPTKVEMAIGMRHTNGGTGNAAQEYRRMKATMDPMDFSAQKILCQIDGESAYIVRPVEAAPMEDEEWATVHKGAADVPTFVDLASLNGTFSAAPRSGSSSHADISTGAPNVTPDASARTASSSAKSSKSKTKVAKAKR